MDREYEIGRYFSEGWEIFKENMSVLVVASIIFIGIHIAAQLVPLLGTLIELAIAGPLLGGFFIICNEAAKGNEVNIGQVFEGFQKFLPLFLVNLVVSIILIIAMMVIIAPVVLILGVSVFNFEDMAEPPLEVIIPFVISILIAIFIAMIIQFWYIFSSLFVVDQDEDFWQAMESSRALWFNSPVIASLFLFLASLVWVIGIFVFFVGIIFTMPYAMLVITVAYRNLTGGSAAVTTTGHMSPYKKVTPPPLTDTKEENRPEVAPPPSFVSGEYRHCYVFLEGREPTEKMAGKIASLGSPDAFGKLPEGAITGRKIDEWPNDDSELATTITREIRMIQSARADIETHTDASTYRVKVWKGRDKNSGARMAVATVTQK